MPNKQEILDTIARLQAQLQDCDCHGDSPVFVPQEDEDYHFITNLGEEYIGRDYDNANEDRTQASFSTADHAEQHGKALRTLLLLRAQKGVVPMKHGAWQYLVEARGDGNQIEVRKRRDAGVKLSRSFSPAFETEEQARRAIDTVGKGNILAAMKVLAWG